jgi:uncharacterized membrane protein YbhN (UPF0104 family)
MRAHPEHITQLRQLQPRWLGLMLVANISGMAALTGLYQILVRMLGVRLPTVENMLLTIYSSIANFFGPLQSGPGVRAAYLKAKHHIPLRKYVFVTLLAYGVYAVLSVFCLAVGTRPWWQTLGAVMLVTLVSAAVIRLVARRRGHRPGLLRLQTPLLVGLVVCTAAQIACIALRYYCALRAGGAEVSLGQVLSYTGAANFALFVSVTPDAIGIREAFLYLAQNIHGVPTADIVSASLVDRAVYVLFLGMLFVGALVLHAKERVLPTSAAPPSKKPKKRPEDSA